MSLAAGQHVLRDRYQLVGSPMTEGAENSTWIGVDDSDSPYLLKVWPFEGETPDDYKRALWDAELRNLYRVGSSPGAEETILVIRDAGLEPGARCFIMALEAIGSGGYRPLSEALRQRAKYPWLSTKESLARGDLWKGLLRIAEGLRLLHEQFILHRNLEAEAVFFSPEMGTESFRLGGFEWSIRLGQPGGDTPLLGWAVPPEFFSDTPTGYRRETDWYGFGMLAARCLLNLEGLTGHPPKERVARVLQEIDKATAAKLGDPERVVLKRLVDPQEERRLIRGDDIVMAIEDIASRLARGEINKEDERPLVVVLNPQTNRDVPESALAMGFEPNPEQPGEAFNPHNLVHVTALTDFLQRDLNNASLLAVPRQPYYLLIGERMTLLIHQYEYTDTAMNETRKTWSLAFCTRTGEVRGNAGGSAYRELPEGSVIVRTRRQAAQEKWHQRSRDWSAYLPTIDPAASLRASLARFHEFIRCTNQLELLIRDAEIFSYEIVNEDRKDQAVHRLTIRETPRKRPPAKWCDVEGGLTELLQREKESGKRDCDKVVLCQEGEDGLRINNVPPAEHWTVVSIDPDKQQVDLQRSAVGPPRPDPPQVGTVRGFGMFGQISLLGRRNRAITRLQKHSYLLRALAAPAQVYMDTGPNRLLVPLPTEKVDEAKQAVMEDILRVRPIYALQGPPGTGKTTLVSYLIRQILEDDPAAQILITAQAHFAVDVLRAKIRDESFQGLDQPLAVRLGGTEVENQLVPGTVPEVSLRVLQKAKDEMDQLSERTPIQEEWVAAIDSLVGHLESNPREAGVGDFCELVRRGASLTYCTTSAGDLEDLADKAQSFDWAIVEEAGKAHGFDLALPLQAGHRWLLIGDPDQLPPYRFKDYSDGIEDLETAVEHLQQLPSQSRGLLDIDWIRAWEDREPEERHEFKKYAKEWLNTFSRILSSCKTAVHDETIDKSIGAMAGLLSRQYRMHPTIGDLISVVYYEDKLINKTCDEAGRPHPRVVHPFVSPTGIAGKAVVWIDLPWANVAPDYHELGPDQGSPRYRNPQEMEVIKRLLGQLRADTLPEPSLSLTVLSPYSQQVTYLRKHLSQVRLPQGVVPKPNLRGKRGRDGGEEEGSIAYTVDSFQGNEADIIIVSLVRNNTKEPGDKSALGFLDEKPRLNVLQSRAEQLLILVGSWEFFSHQAAHVPLDDPLQEVWHWKKSLHLLEGWFREGKAVKLNANLEVVS